MHSYVLRCFLKEQRHLCLCQPYGFVLQPHVNLCVAVGRLVDDYLVINVLHIFITSIVSFYCMAKTSFPL